MHIIFYTNFIFTILQHFLHYQNLSTEKRLLLIAIVTFRWSWFKSRAPLYGPTKWSIFIAWGLHLIHINLNSLLLKIEELHHVACLSNTAVIRITETKLDSSIFGVEVEMDGYTGICAPKPTKSIRLYFWLFFCRELWKMSYSW